MLKIISIALKTLNFVSIWLPVCHKIIAEYKRVLMYLKSLPFTCSLWIKHQTVGVNIQKFCVWCRISIEFVIPSFFQFFDKFANLR